MLFLKPNAICLSRKDQENGVLNAEVGDERRNSTSGKHRHPTPPEHSYFLFPTTNVEKEDWYFALLRGSKITSGSTKSLSPTDPTLAAIPAHFEPSHMFSLIQAIHSSDAQLQTRWLNALVGRIFLGVYQTKHAEQICIAKVTKKIARINRPAFLSDIKLQKVVVGTQAPVFTQPRLKELSAAGELAMDVNVTYNGGFRMEIATVATLQLGSRFKPRQVNLSMAVTVKKLEGKMLLKIKKPPSNRLWLGFYEAPVMDLTIEPIVSSRQITYTMVLRAIESKIREAVLYPYDCRSDVRSRRMLFCQTWTISLFYRQTGHSIVAESGSEGTMNLRRVRMTLRREATWMLSKEKWKQLPKATIMTRRNPQRTANQQTP
jgi:hypothetical protein